MAGTLIALIVTVSLMFGSAGAVFAAQDSQPNDILYPVKILSEDARLGLAAGPQTEMDLALTFAARRVGELAVMVQTGDPVPEELGYRLENHVNLALRAAAGLEDPEIGPALEQARVRLQEQLHILNTAQANGPLGNDPVLERVQARLRVQIGLADLGLEDPVAFRLRLRQTATATEDPSVTPEPGAGYGPGLQKTPGCPDCTPQVNGESYGPGPFNQGGTTQPDEGYGPGPGTGPGPSTTQTVDPSYDGNGNPSDRKSVV